MSEENKNTSQAAAGQASNAVQAAAQAAERVLAARPLLTPSTSVHRRAVEDDDPEYDWNQVEDSGGELAAPTSAEEPGNGNGNPVAAPSIFVPSELQVANFLATFTKEKTRKKRRAALHGFSRFLKKPLLAARLDDLIAYNAVLRARIGDDGMLLSPATTSFEILHIQEFYAFLHGNKVLPTNVMEQFGPAFTRKTATGGKSAKPAKVVPAYRSRRISCDPMTKAQVKRLFRYLASRKDIIGRRNRVMFLLILQGNLDSHDLHDMLCGDLKPAPNGGKLLLRRSGRVVHIPEALYRDIIAYRTDVKKWPMEPKSTMFCSFKDGRPARWNSCTAVNHALKQSSLEAKLKFTPSPSMLRATKNEMDRNGIDMVSLILQKYPSKAVKKPVAQEKTLFDSIMEPETWAAPPVPALVLDSKPVPIPIQQQPKPVSAQSADEDAFLIRLASGLYLAQRQAMALPGGKDLAEHLDRLLARVYKRINAEGQD